MLFGDTVRAIDGEFEVAFKKIKAIIPNGAKLDAQQIVQDLNREVSHHLRFLERDVLETIGKKAKE